MSVILAKPGDEDFNLDEYPLYNLNRTSATYVEEMSKAMRELGFDQTVWRILMLLDDKNPSTVGELSRKSVTKMSTVTRMLTRMESEGLVKRDCQPDDRRIILVRMTAKGRRALTHMKATGGRVYERAVSGLSLKEIEALTKTLKKIRHNLNRSPYAR